MGQGTVPGTGASPAAPAAMHEDARADAQAACARCRALPGQAVKVTTGSGAEPPARGGSGASNASRQHGHVSSGSADVAEDGALTRSEATSAASSACTSCAAPPRQHARRAR